jgi:hypothetical protein
MASSSAGSRWAHMPRAHRDRFWAYSARGTALLLVALVVELAFPIGAAAYPGGTVSVNLPFGPPCQGANASDCGYETGLEILWNGAASALVLLSLSSFLFARSVLRQFDLRATH